MRQKIQSTWKSDEKGNPTGGITYGEGIDIHWQEGALGNPPDIKKINGAFVEGVVQAAIDRLNLFQASKFKCRENALAITKLEEALHWLDHRTSNRSERKVEGTYEI